MRMKNNGICDYKAFEKVNPYEYKRKLNSKDMTDYKSLGTTLLVEQKLKGTTNDKTDSNCFSKMLLCTERTRGYNIYKIKIIATVIFPTGGKMQNSLYTNNNEYCLAPATRNETTSILCPRLNLAKRWKIRPVLKQSKNLSGVDCL